MNRVTPEDKYHITDGGLRVDLVPVSLYETELIREGTRKAWIERGETVLPPTYTIETVGGGKLEKELSADNLVVEDNEQETQRRQEAWAKHVDAVDRMNEEIGHLITDVFLDGIALTEVPATWIAAKKKRHIAIPEDKEELLSLYKRLEVAKSMNDINSIRAKVIKLSLPNIPDNSAVGAAESTFPGTVQAKTD